MQARTQCMDHIVKTLWRASHDHSGYTLIAVGGYGAGKLHPHSDIDLLILRSGDKKTEREEAVLSGFIARLWDLGLVVGHSVRTKAQCIEIARHDVSAISSLMDMRLIDGCHSLLTDLKQALLADSLWPLPDFLEAKLSERQQREEYLKHHGTPMQPDVKNGRGGLRDLQTLSLLGMRAYGTGNFAALAQKGLLEANECRALEDGRRFLWRLRWALHIMNNRAVEALNFDQQSRLAHCLGYSNDTQGAADLLRAYYLKQRSILNVETIFMRQLEQRLRPRTNKRVLINQDFTLLDGYLEINDSELFIKKPVRLIELFALLGRTNVRGIAAAALRLIHHAARRIDENFRGNPACRQAFIKLLRGPGSVAKALEAMARCGVLGAYLPVFGKITGLAQFDMFHIYPVDQHTLAVINNVDAYRQAPQADQPGLTYQIFQQLDKKELLYLAALFHDVCKGQGGDHSNLGADEAQAFCLRHGLSEDDAREAAWLVRHHLLMSMTAQRKDVSDAGVVQAFAERVQNMQRLKRLYLLTIADIKGTNPKEWNAWKDALLLELYKATELRLQLGPKRAQSRPAEVQPIYRSALAHVAKEHHAACRKIWRNLSDEYFLRSGEEEIVKDVQILLGLKDEDRLFVRLDKQGRRGSSVITVFSYKSHDLFARLTRVFSLKKLNVVAAYLGSSRSGRVINRFLVLEPNGLPIIHERRVKEIESALHEAFRHVELPVYQPPMNLDYRQNPSATRVEFDCHSDDSYTTIELHAVDHSGLLSAVADAFLELGVRIVEARINTVGQKVDDLFKVYSERIELSDPQAQDTIRQKVQSKIDRLPQRLIEPKQNDAFGGRT